MFTFDRLDGYIPRQPDDDLPLTGFLLSSLLIAILYLLLWWLDSPGANVYGWALDTIGLLLLAIGFFGFLILRALDQLQKPRAIPGPGIHPASSPLLVYSASFALTGATLAVLALGADLAGVAVVGRFIDLFVTLFVWWIVYTHVFQFGWRGPQPLLSSLTLPRWRPQG
ncbi:MAG TPA: hypothetical protein VEH57_04495 [Thermoplasmata archaeon]|nr:hypothetical protein [Thermoplasmata archaeon]